MAKRALRLLKTDSAISVADVKHSGKGWLLDCEIRQQSDCTLSIRRMLLEKLEWFLQTNEFPTCGTMELRAFLAYVTKSHECDEGRWGDKRRRKAPRPRTVHTYHGHLRTFFRWMIAEGAIEASPMENIAAPIARSDQILPFTDAQVEAILAKSKMTRHPKRDEAIVRMLYDTGMRNTELCNLK